MAQWAQIVCQYYVLQCGTIISFVCLSVSAWAMVKHSHESKWWICDPINWATFAICHLSGTAPRELTTNKNEWRTAWKLRAPNGLDDEILRCGAKRNWIDGKVLETSKPTWRHKNRREIIGREYRSSSKINCFPLHRIACDDDGAHWIW